MAQAKLTMKTAAFSKKMDDMVSRGRDMRAYFKTVVQPQFFKIQAKRWQTENSSEGAHWDSLNPKYRKWKLKRYASFPGGGRRMLVAKSNLFNAVTGRDKSGLSILTEQSRITFSINTTKMPYAKHVAELRPFMSFSRTTKQKVLSGMKLYFFHGVMPRGDI